MDKKVKAEINNIIRKHKYVMFEFRQGKVYWLMNHHRHLDPECALKVFIGVSCPPISNDLRQSNRNEKGKLLYTYKEL
jgi:hypothetical protein